MIFSKDDKIVYPLHGVGTIKQVKNKDSDSGTYKIKIEDKDLMIEIPIKSAKEKGIRKIISQSKANSILKDLLSVPDSKLEENWKKRKDDNREKLKTGKINQIVDVIKMLFIRDRIKKLSTHETNQYQTSFRILVKELSISKKVDEQEINNIVSEKLDKMAQKKLNSKS